MACDHQDSIVIVGAGVIGLSTALMFMSEEPTLKIVVVASHGPDEEPSLEWCSPHAGACQDAYSAPGFPSGDISMQMFRELETKKVPGLRKIDNRDYFTADDPKYLAIKEGKVKLKPSLQKFRTLNEDELVEGTVYGESYEIVLVDPLPYLRYLLDQFTSKGGQYIKSHLTSLHAILTLPQLASSSSSSIHQNTKLPIKAIINCSGLGSSTLLDVHDETLHYSRGQYCDVYAPHAEIALGKWCNDWFITVFPLGKEGKVRIGATRELDDSGEEIRQDTLEWQLRKALELEPKLHPRHQSNPLLSPSDEGDAHDDWKDLKVLDVAIGRRPTRLSSNGKATGPRVEISSERIDGNIMVIHNYGHSTLGFETSWDSARIVLDLYRKAVTV